MKILLVSKYFFPQITPRSFRTTELAKEFARQGHDVTVIFPTGPYDYESFAFENNIRIKNLGTLHFKNIRFKGNKIEFLSRKILNKILEVLFEFPDIELMFKVSKILKKEKGFDLLISIAFPHSIHWGISLVWEKRNNLAKYWIADCGDPFMGNKTLKFKKLFYFKFFEKKFCRKADFITIPFEGAKAGYYSEFHNKIRVVPQGFNFHNIKKVQFLKKLDYPVFAYTGAFYPGKRDPFEFLNHLMKIEKKFKFIIYTAQKDLLETYIDVFKDKLEVHGFIPREELLPIISNVDFLINFDNDAVNQLPSKLIDYAYTGRPVLNISKNTSFEHIDEFLIGNYTHKMPIEDYQKYDIRNVAKQFLKVVS